MTRKTIASGARRCFPFPTVTPPCHALLKTENIKDPGGAILRVVERSMINGRAPLTRLTERFRSYSGAPRATESQKTHEMSATLATQIFLIKRVRHEKTS